MQHKEHAITINAPVEKVWDVLVDVEGYARIFPQTHEVQITESSPTHQIVRIVAEVAGQKQSWVSRRDIDQDRRVIAYEQLEKAQLMSHMGGEWRVRELADGSTELVITHDFAPQEGLVGGLIGAKPGDEDLGEVLSRAVDQISHKDLAAVKAEAERLFAAAGSSKS
ncbi:aromatase/cyclase [Kitasatospora sp. NPDC006786]|uniref:aromatase/cyclase n=1 Tax=unclassified Kitasatospora TaxID=2633591 RepID=UPI0033D4E061